MSLIFYYGDASPSEASTTEMPCRAVQTACPVCLRPGAVGPSARRVAECTASSCLDRSRAATAQSRVT